MSADAPLHGLSCPRCGGMVAIPEGQEIVICPFCDLRSVVSGEHGIRRYQVPQRVEREAATAAYQKFLSGSMAIARDVHRTAQLTEVLMVHLPFWASWGRAVGWIFGEKEVGDSDHRRYEPREVRIVEEMTWNAAACEVGEFGVTEINLAGRPLEPYAADDLHRSGMVFEPVGSADEAMQMANQDFEQRAVAKAGLDRVSQSFVRTLRPRQALVYYPLWVLRYTYRQRAFQVVVDGFSGEVLYGKAPGNSFYRAAILVGGRFWLAGRDDRAQRQQQQQPRQRHLCPDRLYRRTGDHVYSLPHLPVRRALRIPPLQRPHPGGWPGPPLQRQPGGEDGGND